MSHAYYLLWYKLIDYIRIDGVSLNVQAFAIKNLLLSNIANAKINQIYINHWMYFLGILTKFFIQIYIPRCILIKPIESYKIWWVQFLEISTTVIFKILKCLSIKSILSKIL